MSPVIELQQIDEVPREARVCHYDELSPLAKHRLAALVDRDTPTAKVDHVRGFGCCEVVKYTDYYKITKR